MSQSNNHFLPEQNNYWTNDHMNYSDLNTPPFDQAPFQSAVQSRDITSATNTAALWLPCPTIPDMIADNSSHLQDASYQHTAASNTQAPPMLGDYAETPNIFDEILHGSAAFHAERFEFAPNTCQQCHETLPNRSRLDSHAKEHKHKAYSCLCGESFSRFDVMRRHINKFNPAQLHPCPYCNRAKSFPRADHLTQHLRSFHNIEIPERCNESLSRALRKRHRKKVLTCPHRDCKYHSQEGFHARKDFTQHLRNFHNESLFPCRIRGCRKAGVRGFFRESDFNKHMREHKEEEHEQNALAAQDGNDPEWSMGLDTEG